MQASNFGGTFDQLFLWIFLCNFHRRCLSTSSIPWYKKVKNDQKLKSRGGGPALSGLIGKTDQGRHRISRRPGQKMAIAYIWSVYAGRLLKEKKEVQAATVER